MSLARIAIERERTASMIMFVKAACGASAATLKTPA